MKEVNIVMVDGVRRNWRLSLQRPKIETRKLNEWQGGLDRGEQWEALNRCSMVLSTSV